MDAHHFASLRFFSLSLSVAMVMGLTSASARSQDLQTAFQQAVATSHVTARAQAQLDAEMQSRPLARAELLPHLEAFADGGMNTARVTGFSSTPISTGYHSDTFNIGLTQSLFDGQALVSLKQADSRIQSGRAALAFAQQSLALDVTRAYFGVLQAQANEHVVQQQIELFQAIADQTRSALQVGTGDIISVQEAQARLDAAKADQIAANNDVEVLKARLARLTHSPVGALQDVKTPRATGPEPDALDFWLQTALKNQPLVRQARASLQTSTAQVQYEKRARWPTLTLSGGGQHATGTLIPPLTINQAGASLNLAIPIFEGGTVSAKVRQAEALSEARRAEVLILEDQVRLNTQTAFLTLQNSVARFQAAQQSAASARLSMEGTRKGYEIGTRSIIDLLTSTSNYAAAQRNYYLALYTHLVARIELKAAAGVLAPSDIESVNALLH
ncbi:MAG: TolC family outer membrane protein [Acidobacteriota bacterium]